MGASPGGLGVFAGLRQSFVRYRAIRGAVGGERRRAGLDRGSPFQGRAPAAGPEVARGDRHAAAPVPQGAVQRAELGESASWRINHRRAAGHRLARRAIAGLGDDGMARRDQIAAGPVRRRDRRAGSPAGRPAADRSRRNGSRSASNARVGTSPGRSGRIGRCRDRPAARVASGRGGLRSSSRRSRPWLATMPTSIAGFSRPSAGPARIRNRAVACR